MTATSNSSASGASQATPGAAVYDIPFVDAGGRQRTLGEYRGDVLLITNTASY